jgi:hypothetical protein
MRRERPAEQHRLQAGKAHSRRFNDIRDQTEAERAFPPRSDALIFRQMIQASMNQIYAVPIEAVELRSMPLVVHE